MNDFLTCKQMYFKRFFIEPHWKDGLFDYLQGEMRPDLALQNLVIFEGKFNRLKEERDNVGRAKEALELAEPGMKY